MNRKIKQYVLQKRVFLIILLIAGLGYYLSSDPQGRLRFAVASMFFIFVAYPIGLLSPILAIFFTLFSFLITLPILSSAYAIIAYSVANIHYLIFSVILKGILRRIPAYAKTEMSIRESKQYKWFSKRMDKLSQEVGLAEPRKIKFIELKTCDYCERYITRGSKYCGFCGKEQWL